MYSMTDIHCHSLCLVDDGARSVEQMQQMLDIAYNDGIRCICFTPHFKRHHFDDDNQIAEYNERIKVSFSMACDYALDKHPDMKLYLGNEIMYHHDTYESLSSNRCSFIGDSSYALIEFLPDTAYFEIRMALSNLLRKGVRPILAHVERYSDIARDIKRVYELKELGVLIQVNASSIARLKFGRCSRFIKSLLKKGAIDLIATDAHDPTTYTPIMSRAVALIEKKYGKELARRISQVVPNMILENKKVH